ncbi:DUF418 domain-containing protein [Micromonospora sp. KC606]|nr:DUF418 domain-containing protein [Micromonospora sp. KC606]TDC76406.1 DUF418 domain-containing protein [Micromonospora sp. KC606]
MTGAILRPPTDRRLTDLDALRGFALLGILVVNLGYLASPHHFRGAADPMAASRLGHLVEWLVAAGFETKFYLLFSFLFGYSCTLQFRPGSAPAFLRRLAGLFVIGVLHAVLLFPGDILTTYAVLGLVLLALRRMAPRRALALAVVVTVLLAAVHAGLGALLASGLDATDPLAAADAERTLHDLRGGAGSVIAAHLDQLPLAGAAVLFALAPGALAAMLAGLAAGNRRLFADPDRLLRAASRAQAIGFPTGAAGAVVYASASVYYPDTAFDAFAFAADIITAPLLAAAYAATLLRALHAPWGHRLAALLAPAGRMSLSNYLGQSAIAVLLFTGVGLGLAGRLTPPAVLATALAIYAAQLVLSRRWMRLFRYGPVEWVLRAWTQLARPTGGHGAEPAVRQSGLSPDAVVPQRPVTSPPPESSSATPTPTTPDTSRSDR